MAFKKSSPPKTIQNFPVIGVGASAGGLEAFKRFLSSIPLGSGIAYVLVQHLAPRHESLLPEILTKYTALPVHEISDDINLAPDNIYIIPENKILKSVDGVLKLTPREKEKKVNQSINIFFRSLAETHKGFAIGAILSGSGLDGVDGLKAIKEMGGVTYAQKPETSSFDSMPYNAINSGAVDFVLPPEEIPPHLLRVKKAFKVTESYEEDPDIDPTKDNVFAQVLQALRTHSGHDFRQYKQATIRRRVSRRMVMTQKTAPKDYLEHLLKNEKEKEALFNDILIPVSYFFRDEKIFETLTHNILPNILKKKAPKEKIRIWSAGCSTGEEAYSLAIAISEILEDDDDNRKVQVFASDLSQAVIAKARTGIYGKEDLQYVSQQRLRKYFTKVDSVYHINKKIRDMCVFTLHNFLSDPPFSNLDLISCRNVLIYMDPVLQKKALINFHYGLNKKGILFLGKSETTSSVEDLYNPLFNNHRLFSRVDRPGHATPAFYSQITSHQFIKPQVQLKKQPKGPEYLQKANEIIFRDFTPVGVIVNDKMDIVHFYGDTSPFLSQSPGKPSLNLFALAKEGLSFELRKILKSKNTNKEPLKGSVFIKNMEYTIEFRIIPIITSGELYYIVLFFKSTPPPVQQYSSVNEAASKHIKNLENELEQLRYDIREVTENQESVNEELQSANEELLSYSEELQSLNEELETSSEELQSNNEELTSVNDELMDRQEQLEAARKHAEAIIQTVRQPLCILEKDLRIKSANRAFYHYFDTSESESHDRFIYELNRGQFNQPELKKQLENILPENKSIEDFEFTTSFPKNGERTFLLNANRIINERYDQELILIVLEDITALKFSKLLRESEERFRVMANTAPVLLWIADVDKQINFLNKSWLNFTGRSMEEEMGMGWTQGILEQDRDQALATFHHKFDNREGFMMEYRLRRYDGEYRWVSVRGVPRIAADGEFLGYVGGCMEIHEHKNFSSALEEKIKIHTSKLKESEAFLKTILDITQNLIFIYDFEKRKIIFINKKVEELVGYTSEEVETSEEDIFTPLIHEEDLATVKLQRRNLKKSLDNKISVVEYRLKNKEGGWTYQLSRDHVFRRNEAGKVIQYLSVSTDVTGLKNANLKLISQNHELARTNAELASFSSIASHDLKEPLRKIQMFCKIIIEKEKKHVSDESKLHLDRVTLSANRMQQLIDDLINYTRTSNQKDKFKKTNLNELLNEVLEELTETIEETQAEIAIDTLPTIEVIPSQFRQLFSNLIRNAIKYKKPDEHPRIIIQREEAISSEFHQLPEPPKTAYYKVMVKDNGIGFPNEYREKIFKPFQRLHGKTSYPGTGIGLSICRKIMNNHEGYIFAEGESGKGAVFYMLIPKK